MSSYILFEGVHSNSVVRASDATDPITTLLLPLYLTLSPNMNLTRPNGISSHCLIMVILHSSSCKWITAPEPDEQNNFIWGPLAAALRWVKKYNYRLETNCFFLLNFKKY